MASNKKWYNSWSRHRGRQAAVQLAQEVDDTPDASEPRRSSEEESTALALSSSSLFGTDTRSNPARPPRTQDASASLHPSRVTSASSPSVSGPSVSGLSASTPSASTPSASASSVSIPSASASSVSTPSTSTSLAPSTPTPQPVDDTNASPRDRVGNAIAQRPPVPLAVPARKVGRVSSSIPLRSKSKRKRVHIGSIFKKREDTPPEPEDEELEKQLETFKLIDVTRSELNVSKLASSPFLSPEVRNFWEPGGNGEATQIAEWESTVPPLAKSREGMNIAPWRTVKPANQDSRPPDTCLDAKTTELHIQYMAVGDTDLLPEPEPELEPTPPPPPVPTPRNASYTTSSSYDPMRTGSVQSPYVTTHGGDGEQEPARTGSLRSPYLASHSEHGEQDATRTNSLQSPYLASNSGYDEQDPTPTVSYQSPDLASRGGHRQQVRRPDASASHDRATRPSSSPPPPARRSLKSSQTPFPKLDPVPSLSAPSSRGGSRITSAKLAPGPGGPSMRDAVSSRTSLAIDRSPAPSAEQARPQRSRVDIRAQNRPQPAPRPGGSSTRGAVSSQTSPATGRSSAPSASQAHPHRSRVDTKAWERPRPGDTPGRAREVRKPPINTTTQRAHGKTPLNGPRNSPSTLQPAKSDLDQIRELLGEGKPESRRDSVEPAGKGNAQASNQKAEATTEQSDERDP
ncbi:hypothetical protein BU26DRAFT_273390 [Trematosphaeria pertusa]|uniref:Uncharacterized protein n=1 Tax=Trematosphaeria pertusa TaxID=390896 RepID=A0A6A6IKH6_9PLEO|nr:uncharacterized protein BU26DRAFT_273390 [Trematosphaeria pertusa]KAF2250911.1 hypothetical protein BU26DRAFT_273390 [Trematosphaeria pertusa]